MEENNLNAEVEEVVQPQDENTGAEGVEVTNPQTNVDDMSDEDFDTYIQSAKSDTDEVQESTASTVQDDGTGEAEPAEDNEYENTDKTAEKPFKVFKTQEEYQGNINNIIGERLKKSREGMETLEGLKTQALSFYGGEDADNALLQLIEDLQSQNAEKQGLSVDDYKKQSQDSIDARRYREEQSRQYDMSRKIEEKRQKWQNESEELKHIVPDFDFKNAMQNKAFYDNIVNGMSVASAYLAVNKQSASKSSEAKSPRREVTQVGNMKGAGIGKVEANPESMSDKDFAMYINRIKD